MNFGRYKNADWLELYKRRRAFLLDCAMTRNCPAKAIENGAVLLLEAHHVGPWRMIWSLFKYEFGSWWLWYVWRPVHSIKRRLGVRSHKEADLFVEQYEREAERREQEAAAVQELVRQL